MVQQKNPALVGDLKCRRSHSSRWHQDQSHASQYFVVLKTNSWLRAACPASLSCRSGDESGHRLLGGPQQYCPHLLGPRHPPERTRLPAAAVASGPDRRGEAAFLYVTRTVCKGMNHSVMTRKTDARGGAW